MTVFGIAISIVWFLVAKGTIYWIGKWREAVIKADKRTNFNWYGELEENQNRPWWSVAEKVTQGLPLLVGLVWVAFLVILIRGPGI